MKSQFTNFIFVLLAFLPVISFAQAPIKAVDDSISLILGQAITYNVKENDTLKLPFPIQLDVAWIDIYPCIGLSNDGVLSFLPDANTCVGDTLKYIYRYSNCNDSISKCTAEVRIELKRIKNCFFVRMEDFIEQVSVDSPQCANVCENSGSTFLATYNPNSTYIWSVTGGTITPGVNPAIVNIAWGEMGLGTVSLTITNGGVSTTINACVAIMEGPVASFLTSSTNICKNSSVTFDNTSTGGTSFNWNFGDGTVSSASSVTHQYTTPGIHTACLIVTRDNYDNENSPLCCCTDTICVDIIVDSLAGPNIFCASTLCAYDSTKYWTDAVCDSLKWTVMENGAPLTFSVQSKDTICVQWGPGPVGTVTLEVKDCTSAYCAGPVTVNVPIIPSTDSITGKTELCAGAVESYTVPKWMGVYYDWEVTGDISFIGEGTNTITVYWGTAGTGTITLNYYSDFLGGLPAQDPADCMGTATLNVNIKANFNVFTHPQTVVCANHISTYTAFPLSNYNWTVSGGPLPNIQPNGPNSIIVTWSSGPGNYIITAMPTDPTVFCNDVVTKYMQVLEVPLPSIDGPDTICPGQTYTYFAQTNQTGVGFNWAVTGGNVSSFNGNPLTVTWGATGPYALHLQQFMPATPMCHSDTFTMQVKPKAIDSFTLIGPKLVCINSLVEYTASPAQQDPDAIYTWTIVDTLLGSVVLGQGTPDIKVQWNNVADTATLTLTVELCDSTLSNSILVIINKPKPLNIVQKDTSCQSQNLMLEASAGFIKYMWSNAEITQTIHALANTVYTVTACDSSGCIVSDKYDTDTAVVLTSPPSALPKLIVICILPCDSTPVTINAPSNSSLYSYSWTCDGIVQPNMTSVFTHLTTCEIDTFVYVVTLTDIITGCSATSMITVIQTNLCGGGSCNPDPTALISFTATNQTPTCNTVEFEATPVNAAIVGWNFGDLSGTGPNLNPVHTYAEVGDYTVILYAHVLNTMQPPDSCTITDTLIVHIPLKAEFSCTSICSKVTFTNLTTHNHHPGDAPDEWLWEFGDHPTNPSTSTDKNPPMFTYSGPGTYTVTLTVKNANDCESTFSKSIEVGGVSLDTIEIAPDTLCVGTPLNFCGLPDNTNIVQWDWDFGDGATNGSPKPFHSYLSADTYIVGLTITDAEGCTDVETMDLVIHPSPIYEEIMVTPGLSVCDSTEMTLMAATGSGYTYLWSNLSTDQFIKTDSAGTYSVTITDANGCTMVPDPVTIVVYPTPQATISGTHYICGFGCVTLSTPYGQHFTYFWSTGATSSTISVCNAGVYTVMVTDTTSLKCSAVSASFNVLVAVRPIFNISAAPDDCEGMPVMLHIDTSQSNPHVMYTWNTGQTGTSITVTQAGSYLAVGTDTITGCTGSALSAVYPLPDLCILPVGCYEICNPDSICGPPGLADYQWRKDGINVPDSLGGKDRCLNVTQSGTYSLTGTNGLGCTLTSDSLMLTVIDCTCYGLSASATPAGTDSCCWQLSYNNPLNTLHSLTIRSNDADLGFSSVSGPFSTALGVNSVTLSNVVSGMPIASGALSNFITVCLSNVISTPQQIIFDWYDVNNILLCSDTVNLFSQKTLVDTIFLCPGEAVSLGGGSYTAPDIVTFNLSGAGGVCDTLAAYHLLLSPVHTVTLSCPSNITVSATGTTAVVNYAPPTATSTCPNSVPTVIQLPPFGSTFSLGETTVCYFAKEDDNCCSKSDTCCFKITVLPEEEDPCDEQMTACVKFELLDITEDAAGNQTYRMRVTNHCAGNLSYVAFQVPNGIAASAPANNTVYTAPSGRPYTVRNPNFSPYYSIRFKSNNAGISNGQSDIFEYILPPQVCQGCILATVRIAPKIFYEAHLCCMMPNSLVAPNGAFEVHVLEELTADESTYEIEPSTSALQIPFSVFPNPTDGTLFADLSAWEGEQLQVQIYNSQGQALQRLFLNAAEVPQQIEMPKGMSDGLYFLEVFPEKGVRQMARFVLNR